MQYTLFGRRSGLRVSEFGLGTGNFGTRWGHGSDAAESRRMFDRFADAGGTLIDTADGYQFGESEELLGGFMTGKRDQFVVASKFTLGDRPNPGILGLGNSRKTMLRALDASLKRLNTDYLDLYWVHFPDGMTPIEEILRALDDMVRAGKILHAGLSNFPAWRVARAATLAELHNTAPIVGIQVEYSLAERSADRELLPMAEGLGLGAALWSPLGGGFLTGKYRQSADGRLSGLKMLVHTENEARKTATLDAVLAIADEVGVTASQIAVAWLRQRARLSPTAQITIIGPRTVAQLEDYLAALQITLDDGQMQRLDQASAITLGVPHDATANVAAHMVGVPAEAFYKPAIPVV